MIPEQSMAGLVLELRSFRLQSISKERRKKTLFFFLIPASPCQSMAFVQVCSDFIT
jgi:hypothetical protein